MHVGRWKLAAKLADQWRPDGHLRVGRRDSLTEGALGSESRDVVRCGGPNPGV